MQQREVEIVNKLGLHARASAKLTQLAAKFQCDVHMSRATRRVNAKSIMGVMMLAAGKGITIQIETDGPDEADAMRALVGTIGLGQAGARITFAGANPDAIIRFVVGKAERLHLKIQNVQVAEVGSEHHVTVGVSGRRAVDLVDAAWAAGHKVRGVVDGGRAA